MQQDIWILRSADKRNLSLIPSDLDYFQTHFIGQPMAERWNPPSLTIDGKALRLRDFVSWMIQAPVISDVARSALEPLVSKSVEFLPLIELRKKRYYAMNVLRLVDCLDRSESEILYSPDDPERILTINKFQFDRGRIISAPIFKIPDDPSCVFVMQAFIDAVIDSRLTGAKFADPTVNPWAPVLNGQ